MGHGACRKDYAPDKVWYEPADIIGQELREAFEARVAIKTSADEAAVREEAELEELEVEVMPHP